MSDIEFSIGPSDESLHYKVLEWLFERSSSYKIIGISFDGDHYSEIHVKGDYEKAYEGIMHFETKPGISFEHWE